MKLSIQRALKFLCYLIVVFCLVYGMMLLVGMAQVKPEYFGEFLATTRGQYMIAAILGLSALYPFYGVTTKKMTRVGTSDIILKMEENGYKMISKEGKKLSFIPVSYMDRLKLRFDDRIDIDNSGNETIIKGARRAVYTILYKLGGDIL